MKKIKLHKWSALFLAAAIAVTGCSRKSFPANSSSSEEKYESAAAAVNGTGYTPPSVITIPDEKAKTNKEGELYYDDEYGYRYWRNSDGKYYLDQKYENGSSPKKKLANRKKNKKNKGTAAATEYASSR